MGGGSVRDGNGTNVAELQERGKQVLPREEDSLRLRGCTPQHLGRHAPFKGR